MTTTDGPTDYSTDRLYGAGPIDRVRAVAAAEPDPAAAEIAVSGLYSWELPVAAMAARSRSPGGSSATSYAWTSTARTRRRMPVAPPMRV
jgi:hypothetical protein